MTECATLLLCHTRRPGLSRAAFFEDWARIRARRTNAALPRLDAESYDQVHRIPVWQPIYVAGRLNRSWPVMTVLSLLQGHAPPSPFYRPGPRWDLVERFRWIDTDTMRRALASREGQHVMRCLARDAWRRTEYSARFACRTLRPKPGDGTDSAATLYFLSPRSGLGNGPMLSYWTGTHGPFALSLATQVGFSAYDQHIPAIDQDPLSASPQPGPIRVAIADLRYPSIDTIARGLTRPASFLANLRLVIDEAGLIDAAHSTLVLGRVLRQWS